MMFPARSVRLNKAVSLLPACRPTHRRNFSNAAFRGSKWCFIIWRREAGSGSGEV